MDFMCIGGNGMDWIDIGPCPADEPCQQVGMPGYDEHKAQSDAMRFVEAIRKVVGPEPTGAHLMVKQNHHDFGTYYSVVCQYDENIDGAIDYALKCETDAPVRWPEGV